MVKILNLLIVIFIFNVNGQCQEEIQENKECYLLPNNSKFKSVDSFKDSLKVTVDLDQVYVGRKTSNISFFHSEYITNESTLIEVIKGFALRVSIARVISNGSKRYLYKIHLFEKQGECWKSRNAFSEWDVFKPGRVNGGYYHGRKGRKDCFGYHGSIRID